MKQSGIYKIQSLINGKIYVGSAVCLRKRIRDHKRLLRNNMHRNKKLQNHVNKYGLDDLVFSLVCFCDIENLIPVEQFYLDSWKPVFNNAKIAGSSLGVKFKLSEETKAKMRAAKRQPRSGNKGQRKGMPRQYSVKVYKGAENVNSKKLLRFNELGDFKLYPSLSSVNADGFLFQNVARAMRRGHTHKGYRWEYLKNQKLNE